MYQITVSGREIATVEKLWQLEQVVMRECPNRGRFIESLYASDDTDLEKFLLEEDSESELDWYYFVRMHTITAEEATEWLAYAYDVYEDEIEIEEAN